MRTGEADGEDEMAVEFFGRWRVVDESHAPCIFRGDAEPEGIEF
jgi:hypothetical protein